MVRFGDIMIFRTQDEVQTKLNRMEAPKSNFRVEGDGKEAIQIQSCMNIAFESGYKQAIREMKEYFNIKGNGVHTRYEE